MKAQKRTTLEPRGPECTGTKNESGLTPQECVALLQDVAKRDSSVTGRAARRVAQHGSPHPLIARAALQLLVVTRAP